MERNSNNPRDEGETRGAHLLIRAEANPVERTKREKEGAEAASRGLEGREENVETIGGAEAAAFHVGWHRLPLKSLLLFVSSSKIMIVCPRDLLLPRPSLSCGAP